MPATLTIFTISNQINSNLSITWILVLGLISISKLLRSYSYIRNILGLIPASIILGLIPTSIILGLIPISKLF